MLSNVLQKAINDQIAKELYASYLYLSMSAYCERQNLSGFAGWLRGQSVEETAHGMRFFDFLAECDGTILLQSIPSPAAEFASPLAVFQAALEHEESVTKSINRMYELAVKEKSYALQNHLQWFIAEQIEEEGTARKIVGKLQLIGSDVASLLALDRELGSRENDD